MSRYCRVTIVMMSLMLASACRARSGRVDPSDPFAQIAVTHLSIAPLGGASVLLLVAGGLVAGDSANPLPELDARRSALLDQAYAALDTAVRRDGREVTWMSLDEQQRAVRRNPTISVEPERLATQYLFDPRVMRIPDPLWSQVRTLAALTGARYLVVPAGVKIAGTSGALTASYVVVLADARSGNVLARVRAQGAAAPSVQAALRVAAGSLIATPLH